MISHKTVNIASIKLYRANRGGDSIMILELDSETPKESIKLLEKLEGVEKVTYY